MKNKIGLRQRILNASSKEEVQNLLKEGKSYKDASSFISHRWDLAASRRIEVLEKQVEIKKIEHRKELKKQKTNV